MIAIASSGRSVRSHRKARRATRIGRSTRRVGAALVLAALFACVSWQPPEPVGRYRTAPIEGAGGVVGAQECYACHDSYEGHYAATTFHADCESCHGPGQLHVYTARATDIAYPGSETCAACHGVGSKTLLGWTTSPHARSGVLCSDCHDTHNRELLNLRAVELESAMLPRARHVTRLCASCHPGVVAQFDLPSHHPLREGMVECTDCHGAHEGRRASLGARTQMCESCHQEVVGPWIYEHSPVNEDCGYCHSPHGASADSLLEASQPAACISCHSIAAQGAVHDPYALTTRCTDCHNAVHGSYTDPHLRR